MLKNGFANTKVLLAGLVLALLATSGLANAQSARVKCEVRDDRSKISVDGRDLAPAGGDFKAAVESGANLQMSGVETAIGDEAEFDFDSDADDVADGATQIGADFIQGTPALVTGTIRTANGAFVAAATVQCRDRR